MSTIIICEKTKAARAIAEALGQIKIINYSNISLYEVPSRNLIVIPLRGHIMQYENTEPYKKWKFETNRDIITDPNAIAKIPTSYATPYISALKMYGKSANKCIIGTDADIEGTVIGLLDSFPFVKSVNNNIVIEQLWLDSLQKNDIINAYNNLIPPKWTWAYAGDARARIDAIIGFSATREITLILNPILKKLNCKVASIGRVQTCLLYLLYLRENLIRNFIPQKYWNIMAKLIPNLNNQQHLLTLNKNEEFIFKLVTVNHKQNPFKDKSSVNNIYNNIKDEKQGIIDDIIKKTQKVDPPSPLNTSSALMLITSVIGINADLALKTMEDLYLNKIISYPRTDTDIYKPNYNHLNILNQFSTTKTYGPYTQNLLKNNRIVPTKGKIDAGDHTPITPLMALEPNDKIFENQLQQKVYNVLARYYLALFGEQAEEVKTTIHVKIKNESFIGKFNVLVYEGFYAIAPFLKPQYDIDIPLSKGIIKINKIYLEEKETQPPPRYTDTTLLKLMELNHLGTKSTRPQHIETLIERQYVKRINRTLYVTELGYLLIDTLKNIWLPFLEPNFTKKVEESLEEIQNGKINMEFVVNKILNEFLILFDLLRANKQNLEKIIKEIETTGNILRDRNNEIIDLTRKKRKKENSQIILEKENIDDIHSDLEEVKNLQKSYSHINLNQIHEESENITTTCPICKSSEMKLIISKERKKFIVCSNPQCKFILPLPKKGYPRILKSKCSICEFNIVKISTRNNKTKKGYCYYICPNCMKKYFETGENIGLCFKCEKFYIENENCIKKNN